jgi:hypothetical protein
MAGKISPNAILLCEKLHSKGIIDAQLEYPDGPKHVDIGIPSAMLFIEVQDISHFTSSKRIISDFNREHYSDKEGFKTFFVTNQILENKDLLEKVANALVDVIEIRKSVVSEMI